MSSAIDLVVLNGPLEGEVIHLRPDELLKLGRAKGGLQVPDLLVSMRHAEISFSGDQYWVQDVGSATGTFVDDQRVTQRSHALRPGMRLRVGETEFEVRDRPRSTVLRFSGAVAAMVILLLGVQAFFDSIDIDYDATVAWFQPIKMGGGLEERRLPIPTSFIRETGVDHRELKILRVTDYDKNNVDEVWLELPTEERIITFGVEGDWRTLAVLPRGCRERGTDQGFPDLYCQGAWYVWDGGTWAMSTLDGTLVWMPPTKLPPAPATVEDDAVPPPIKAEVIDGPPRAHLVSLVRPAQLAGFLAARGVTEPVHYVLCEDALPGARAQVRTERGEIVALSLPCLDDVQLDGADKDKVFGDATPLMIAFTAQGQKAMLRDIGRFLSGDATGLVMGREHRPLWDAINQPATVRRGAFRLTFEGEERMFSPIAADGRVLGPVRDLARNETAVAPSRPVEVARIDGPGRLDLQGCGTVKVETGPWHCLYAKGCGSTQTFLRIVNDACGTGKAVDIPYARGVHRYDDGVVQGYISVESLENGGQIDVLRVRMAYGEPNPQ